MLNYQFTQNRNDRMELETDAVDDNSTNQYSFPVFPGGWPLNGSNMMSYPCMFQQPTNIFFPRPQSPEQVFFPHFSTPSNHSTKIQNKYLQDSPRNDYENKNNQYQFRKKQDISPFDPSDFKSPSPQKNPINTSNNKDKLNCSFGKRGLFNAGIEERNLILTGDIDTGEASFRGEIDDLWKDDSPASFGKDQNILDLGSSLSLNNEEEIDIKGTEDSLILNDLSSILDPLEKEEGKEENFVEEKMNENTNNIGPINTIYNNNENINYNNISVISEEFEGEVFQKKLRLEYTDFNKRRIVQPQEAKKNKLEKVPGKIIQGVKKGCQFYYTRTKGIKMNCVIRVMDNKPIEAQKKFENFIFGYKPSEKTWEYVIEYIREGTDGEIAYILTELIYNLLSSKDDLEIWLANAKMSTKIKNYIRLRKEHLKDKFIYNLYPKE